jgi:hypothetical protein
MAKRLFDIVLSLLLLVLLAPLLAATALAVRLDSPGRRSTASSAWAATACRSRCSSSAACTPVPAGCR